MKNNIVFLSLLVLTACSLDSLTQEAFIEGIVKNSGGLGNTTITTNIVTVTNAGTTNTVTNTTTNTVTNNPSTGGALADNTAEQLNLEILKTFGVNTSGLIQYNTNHGATAVHFSGSYNWYFDNLTSPTRVVRTLTYINLANTGIEHNIHSQLISQYSATVVPSGTFTSFIDNYGAVVTAPSGGVFIRLSPTINKSRYFDGYRLTDWIDFSVNNLMIWVKPVSDTAAIIMGGTVTTTNPSQFIFDFDPEKASYYIKQ